MTPTRRRKRKRKENEEEEEEKEKTEKEEKEEEEKCFKKKRCINLQGLLQKGEQDRNLEIV